MASLTVTITDHTQPALSLYDLAFATTTPGYTVNKSDSGGALPGIGTPDYIGIQAAYTNGGSYIYSGGSAVANDGTNQARQYAAGDLQQYQKANNPSASLRTIFVRGNANDIQFNVEWQ